MTHLEALAAIPPDVRAGLRARSNREAMVHLAAHAGALIGTSCWIVLGLPGWQAVLLPQGLLLAFLFCLEHECSHETPFTAPRLSRAVGRVAGALVLQPFHWFRLFHLAHHRHTNDPVRDPELLSGPRPETVPAFVAHVSGLPTLGGALATMAGNAARPGAPYLPKRSLPRIRAEARAHLALYGLALASLAASPLVFWLWILPLVIGQPFLRLYLLAEHGRCPPVANMLENTRTTFTNRAVRWLAWNMPYHIEHHVAPDVPFHRLPELHRLVAAHLVTTAPGYAAFSRDYARALRPDR